MSPDADSLPDGHVVDGKYRIEGKLGHGAMGSVYRARQLALSRSVALKLLRPGAAHAWSGRKRFAREADLLARLRHPNLVQVYDIELEAEPPYIAMELVEGPSLLDVLEAPSSHARPDPAVVALGLASALEYIHSQGVIHRDIKPGNILLAEGRRALLADFGLSRGAESNPLTTEGFVVGTPSYLAPEQLTQGVTNEQTDLFQLGLVLYELVSGKLFIARVGADVRKILAERMEGRTPELSVVVPECPAALAQAVMRCLEKDPRRRFAKAAELVAALVSLAPSSTGEVPLECVREEAVRPGYRALAARSRGATGVQGSSRSSMPAARQAQPGGEPTGNRRRLVLVATAAVAIATGAMALRQVKPGPETRVKPPPAPAAGVELALQDVDWAYDSESSRLQVRCKVSHPVLSAYRFGTADTLLPRPSAFLEASIPHTPGSTFTLQLLRSDAGPPIRLTEHDLTRSLRTSGARLTATLRDFWTRTRHTDQSLVDEVRRHVERQLMASNQPAQCLVVVKGVLERLQVLEPIRRFLAHSPIFFSSQELRRDEKLALHRVLAPFQPLDSYCSVFAKGYPFGFEIAARFGDDLNQEDEPQVENSQNYVLVSPDDGQRVLYEGSLPAHEETGMKAILCIGYHFRTPGIVKVTVNQHPFYFSRIPERYFTAHYSLPMAWRQAGNTPQAAENYSLTNVNSAYRSHSVPKGVLTRNPTLVQVSPIWLRKPSLLETNNVWVTWISFSKK